MRELEGEGSPLQPVDGTNLPTPASWTSDLLSCEMMTLCHGNWILVDTVIIIIITHSNMLLLSMPSLFPGRSKASLEERGTSLWSSDYQITKQRSDLVQLSSEVVARLGPAQCPLVKGSADAAPLSCKPLFAACVPLLPPGTQEPTGIPAAAFCLFLHSIHSMPSPQRRVLHFISCYTISWGWLS